MALSLVVVMSIVGRWKRQQLPCTVRDNALFSVSRFVNIVEGNLK
jgi:hypothetical protein